MSNNGKSDPAVARRFETTARDPLEGSEARRQLVECLTIWRCDHIDDVALVFSELVTNAVLHAGGAARIAAYPAADEHHVRLEVYDNQPAAPVPCVGGPDGGFGLHIIDRLCERWGTTPTPTGKVVWALIRSECGTAP